MKNNYVAPAINRTAFHCPHCGTKAPQEWIECYGKAVNSETKLPRVWNIEAARDQVQKAKGQLQDKFKQEYEDSWIKDAINCKAGDFYLTKSRDGEYCHHKFGNIFFSVCKEIGCGKAALWVHDKLIIPSSDIEDSPNEDMPDNVRVVYNEARDVYKSSPRAACALLRLCCEMLCEHLEAEGRDFNEKIGFLVGKGLDKNIQRALDIVRFIGNKSIHPGQIDVQEDPNVSRTLFVLVNEIVEEMISAPKRKEILYEKLPENFRNKISQRDKIT